MINGIKCRADTTRVLALHTGNENLHWMTRVERQTLRVELADFEGNSSYAHFNRFKIGDAEDKYRLRRLEGYFGDSGEFICKTHTKNFNYTLFWHSRLVGQNYRLCELRAEYYNYIIYYIII